jgi:phospholipid/cholesterol/gamma-HCH transport system permease protein
MPPLSPSGVTPPVGRTPAGRPPAALSIGQQAGRTVLAFTGRLDAMGAGVLWRPVIEAAETARGTPLTFDLSAVTHCDMAGAALLAAAETTSGGTAELVGTEGHIAELLTRARAATAVKPRQSAAAAAPSVLQFCTGGGRAMLQGIAYLGEVVVAAIRLPSRRRMLRLTDVLRYADQAGVRSLPLVILLGYLMGLILAFQSAIPMRRFGADLFVANLVAVSLIRELGPLLAAVILAGRTGSAFAAEIGTMKVNEELDALSTMGLDAMTMLVLPRLIAVMLVLPAMTLVLELSGLLGMTTVMRSLGFPLAAIMRQVQSAAGAVDLFGGLFKAICFGAAVAAIGCRAGLATGIGPRAVGLAATSAVVGGIVATIVLDGVLALMFYRLHL